MKSEQLCGERWVVVALAQDSSARRATREPLSNLVHSYPRTQMDAWIDAAGTDGPIGSREVLHTPATAVPLAADNPRRRSDDCAFCRQRATCRRHGINMASHQALYYSHIPATHPPTAAGPQRLRHVDAAASAHSRPVPPISDVAGKPTTVSVVLGYRLTD